MRHTSGREPAFIRARFCPRHQRGTGFAGSERVRRRFALLFVTGLLLWPAPAVRADARLLERVIARVDGRPILLSEFRARLRPYQRQLAGQPLARRALALRETQRTLYERMIDDALFERDAARRGLRIGDGEVDAALEQIAKSQKLDRDELRAQALGAGYSLREYRDELRRQLVEQRLIYLDSSKDPAPSDVSALSTWTTRHRAALVGALRRQSCIERMVRW